MTSDIKKVLTQGLLNGYAGGGKFKKFTRTIFEGTSSIQDVFGATYHDEWFVPSISGGGQELVKSVNGEMFTRLYSGGTLKVEKLKSIGTTVDEISKRLKDSILNLKDKTRLTENCELEIDESWKYTYEVVFRNMEFDTYLGIERIFYRNNLVHIHNFILSPIK